MNVQKYNLQPHEPRDVLREVIYEIELLVATSIIPSYNPLINVALLESRLLHTRNLIAFFEMKSRTTYRTSDARIENDDVLAQDYGFPTRTVAISDQDKQRLNKALAHITYERVKYRLQDNMYWPPQTTLLPLLIQCKEFVEHLLTQYPLEGDEQSRARLERLLPGIENAIKLMEKN